MENNCVLILFIDLSKFIWFNENLITNYYKKNVCTLTNVFYFAFDELFTVFLLYTQ